MFNKIKSTRIWEIANKTQLGSITDEIIISEPLQEVQLPSFEEILHSLISNLKSSGFSVKRVSSKKANSIIRVFRDSCQYVEYEGVYWTYGTEVFLKRFSRMLSSSKSDIDYSNHEVRLWYWDNEYFTVYPEFVDYFVKIS